MWQPNTAQWRMIWIVTVFLILCWPPDRGRSLGLKIAGRLADPTDSLPAMPEPLPIGLDDNGDAVTAHDAQEAEYQSLVATPGITRFRMTLKAATDPFDPSTERQILTGLAVLSALVVWRLEQKGKNPG